MKLIIPFLFLMLSFSTYSRGYIPKTIQGKVVDIFIGEIDKEVGERCIVFVKDSITKRTYGFVNDKFDLSCDDAQIISIGWRVSISKHDLLFIKDKKLLALLKSFDQSVFYLFPLKRLKLVY